MFKKLILLLCGVLFIVFSSFSQEKLYPNLFPLGEVSLLDGPFKHAQDLNIQTLLKYDVDRLLAPYRKEAGLPSKSISYQNWIGLDGHIGGHYLSALAISYAAMGDTACKRRMDYMVDELKACQEANTLTYLTWGVGYCGGVPNSNALWSTFKTGNLKGYRNAWVPWYNLHKTYAGLRDAWNYGGSETARKMFLMFCDWGVQICSELTDAQMEAMLQIEHGGMNEIFADAYQMTGDVKYINCARRFSHKVFLDKLGKRIDNLDNVHANTQIPKIIGFQRIAELTHDSLYNTAGHFFWETVTGTRSLALGGNSRREAFPSAVGCNDYLNMPEGPESCNTNNMLKLTEDLFRVQPLAKYADYYERALYNHILSTQHPLHGGFVYFTPARPRHYRVYSAPNVAMWCCVGTGMENHGKYAEFIYSHTNDSVFVNLFIASQLNWKEKGVRIKQETAFPDEERTTLTINTALPTHFKLLIRHPAWIPAGKLKLLINSKEVIIDSQPSTYISLDRIWNNGDVVTLLLPMHTTIEPMPNVPNYIAIMHGPILLGAKTGTEDMKGLVADDSRWGHIANGSLLPLDKAPIIVADQNTISSSIVPVKGKPMTFRASGLFVNKKDKSLTLEPFFRIHDSRYMMYWMVLSKKQYQKVVDSLAVAQKVALELEARTVDKVAPGEQQPEVDHKAATINSDKGNSHNEFWRSAKKGGCISYSMLTQNQSNLSLMVRYWGNEKGNKTFDILIDGVKLKTEDIVGKWNKSEFVNVEYLIPNSLTTGKDAVIVKFQPVSDNPKNEVGALFYVRVLKDNKAQKTNKIKFKR
ncbi:MAG: glycoside hydrolase family 127 protein [Paludibacter sp.]|nr:glycoside hydrolase family 127 protein [Paludibacter sp.]